MAGERKDLAVPCTHAQEGGIVVITSGRIYREEGLGLRRKRRRNGQQELRVIILLPNGLTREVLDFVAEVPSRDGGALTTRG